MNLTTLSKPTVENKAIHNGYLLNYFSVILAFTLLYMETFAQLLIYCSTILLVFI